MDDDCFQDVVANLVLLHELGAGAGDGLEEHVMCLGGMLFAVFTVVSYS